MYYLIIICIKYIVEKQLIRMWYSEIHFDSGTKKQ